MHTIAAAVTHEHEVRRSRFVAHAAPVASEAETVAFLESVADPSATHNGWAWRLDDGYRFNDDGEPAGTAGRPILSVLEGRDLQRVMVVVTRWYGGIKLGAGGLARAYAGTAARALDRARVHPVHPMVTGRLEAPFEDAGIVHRHLAQLGAKVVEERFESNGSRLVFEVRADRFAALENGLRDASSGRVRTVRTDEGR